MDAAWTVVVTCFALLIPLVFYLLRPKRDHVTGALAATSSLNSRTRAAIKALEAALPDRVFAHGNPRFETSLRSFWAAQEQEVVPACIVRPANAEDVATAVKVLAQESANGKGKEGEDLHFAVRSGGHGPVAGVANAKAGVTIDLSELNGLRVREQDNVVEIGPAATWGQVYQKLEKFNLVVAGGRASKVGVGGLTLGGGLSFYSPKTGFVCDSMTELEVVLADGSTVTASSSSCPDLFQALKGGSNNFGIVTKLTARTFPSSKILFGYSYHWLSTAPQHLEAFHGLCDPAHFDENASVLLALAYHSTVRIRFICNCLSYTKPIANPPVLQPLRDIPRFWTTVKVRTLSTATELVNSMSPPHMRNHFQTTTFESDLAMLKYAYEYYEQSIPRVTPGRAITWAFVLQPLPPSTIAHSTPNALGIRSAKTLVNVLLSVTWHRAADDHIVRSAGDELFRKIDAKAKELGVYHPYKYLNYCASGQDPMAGYGEANRRMLQAVSRKYDPEGLFQTGCVGGFKVFEQ